MRDIGFAQQRAHRPSVGGRIIRSLAQQESMHIEFAAFGEFFRRKVLPQTFCIGIACEFDGTARREVCAPMHGDQSRRSRHRRQLRTIRAGHDDTAIDQQYPATTGQSQRGHHCISRDPADELVVPVDRRVGKKFSASERRAPDDGRCIGVGTGNFDLGGSAPFFLPQFNGFLFERPAALPITEPRGCTDKQQGRQGRKRLADRSLAQLDQFGRRNGQNGGCRRAGLWRAPTDPGELMKIVVVILLLVILGSLASAVVFLVKDASKTRRTVRALTVRISLSVVLFLFLLFGYWMGWFVPNQHPF